MSGPKSTPKKPRARKATAPSATSTGASYGGGSGYTAANPSTARGYVYFPTLNPARELTSTARTTILAQARWCVRNMGIAARFQTGIAEMVGFLTPQPSTSDIGWNILAKQLFDDTMGSRLIFDRAGVDNFYTRQITLTQLLLQDGDAGLAFTYDDGGNPQTALYQGPQISTGRAYSDYSNKDGWWDGVKLGTNGRAEKYALLDGDLSKKAAEIEAKDFLLFANPLPGCPRGVSKFATFVSRMLDVREVDNDEMRGIKAANLVGFALTQSMMDTAKNTALINKTIAKSQFGVTPTADEPKTHEIEEIFRGGGTMARLEIGEKIETIHDERRHPNRQELIDYFIRDMAWGTGFPPEVLWFLGQLTGPAVRYMIKSGERAANNYRRLLKDLYCQRVWGWWVSVMIKQGRLRPCNDRRFWNCDWIAPASLTIDAGRDISSGLAEIAVGGNTLENWYAEEGLDWRKALDQRAIEHAYAAELEAKNNLPPGTVLGKAAVNFSPGQPPSPPPAAPTK